MSSPVFNHVFLMGRLGVIGATDTLQQVTQHLNNKGIQVTVESNIAAELTHTEDIASRDDVPNDADLIVVVGGDGSLINASLTALQYDLPIIGVHRGRLGFLTDIPPESLTLIDEVIDGHYIEEHRHYLKATYIDAKGEKFERLALNDVVLLPGDVVRMQEFETHVNDQLLYQNRADGMIVATPTGSTAYALSAGGPIVDPNVNAVVLVPMHAHTLSSRPIIINADSTIRIHINDTNELSPNISCDGRSKRPLQLGSDIIIRRHTNTLRLVHPRNHSYYKVLREKLGWEHQSRRVKTC